MTHNTGRAGPQQRARANLFRSMLERDVLVLPNACAVARRAADELLTEGTYHALEAPLEFGTLNGLLIRRARSSSRLRGPVGAPMTDSPDHLA